MLLSILGSRIARTTRPFESLVRSSYGSLFPEGRTKSRSIVSTAFRASSALTNTARTRPVIKSSVLFGLKPEQVRSASTHGDHVQLWLLERVIALSLPAVIPLAFVFEHPITDGILALLVVMHSHWGLEALIVDYARPLVVGNVLPKVMHVSLYAASAATLAGLLMLIYTGPGIARVCKDGWAIGKGKQTA